MTTMKNTIADIQASKANNRPFNVYCSFHRKNSEPHGVLRVEPWGFGFIAGLRDPALSFRFQQIFNDSEKRAKIDQVARKHKLEWYGEVEQPVTYRIVMSTSESLSSFVADVDRFFKELGSAKM